MTLGQIIDYVKSHEKELVLFNLEGGDPIADEVAARFETRNVRVRTERTASGAPSGLAVLSTDDTVLATVPVSTLRTLVDTGPAESPHTSDQEPDPILDHLRETTFTSYDTEQLLYASREIEDRARRVGGGTVHAGFQRLSTMAGQRSVYADLARRGVTVHAYGVPDAPPPDLGTGQVHAVDAEEIANSWFVVFDGGAEGSQKSALLASELESGAFYGAWTYDAEIVDQVLAYLGRTYLESSDRTHPSSGS